MENKPTLLDTVVKTWPIAIALVSSVLWIQSSIQGIRYDLQIMSSKIESTKIVQSLVDQRQDNDIASLRALCTNKGKTQ